MTLPATQPGPPAPTPTSHPAPTLHRQLGLRDLVLAQVLCVVGSSWVGVAGGLGPSQTLVWIAAIAVFYLPMAAIVIALNTRLPLEGGLYTWAHQAYGPLLGFLTAWNLWVYGIAVTATILYAIPTELAYLIGPSAAWLPEHHLASLAIITTILAAITLAAIRGLEWGKWIHNIGGIAMLTVFVILILLPLYGLLHGTLTHGMQFAPQLPPKTLRTLALFGQMIFGAQCGLEYIAIFAGESRQPARTIARSVWISSPIICAMFILGTSSVVAFATPGKIDFIAPIPQTLRIALGHSGLASLLAMAAITLLQLRLLGAASYIFTGVTRLPMTLGWNHLIPTWFAALHPRHRTPTRSILIASALTFALILLASIGVHAQEAFQLLSNAALTHYELTYLVMFSIPLAATVLTATLRRPATLGKRVLPSPLHTPFPHWLKATSLIGFLATLFSLLISAYPFVTVENPRSYATKILGTIAISNLAAIFYYLIRQPTSTTNQPPVSGNAGSSRVG